MDSIGGNRQFFFHFSQSTGSGGFSGLYAAAGKTHLARLAVQGIGAHFKQQMRCAAAPDEGDQYGIGAACAQQSRHMAVKMSLKIFDTHGEASLSVIDII